MYSNKKKNFAIIIQARLNSTRLPYKILLPLNQNTILEHLISRLNSMGFKKNLFVTIPSNKENKFLRLYLKKRKIKFFTGPESNLIERYSRVCRKIKYLYIIRLTADNPFIDKKLIELAIKTHLEQDCRVSSTRWVKKNKIIRYFPKGQSIDIFDRDLLLSIRENNYNNFDKEHVITYLQKNFKFNKINNKKLKSKFKYNNYSIDNINDYIRLNNLIN